MHSTAAFLSMPNENGIVLGGTPGQGFNDNSARGYPAWMTITTRQVTDVVMNDQEILAVKGGRQVSAPETISGRCCQTGEDPTDLCIQVPVRVFGIKGD